MTRSAKAALLSGLIFPGVGHIVLRYYLRGSILTLISLIGLTVLVAQAMKQALTIVDRISNDEVAFEVGAITELIHSSTIHGDGAASTVAALALGTCWVIGIIDSYRIGLTEEK